MTATDLSEENLVVRGLVLKAQGGDRQALEELFERFLPLRKSLATFWGRRLPNGREADWDDLKQEIDICFLEAVHGYNPARSPEAILQLSLATKWAVAKWYKGVLHPLGHFKFEYLGQYEDDLADGADEAPDIEDPRRGVQARLDLVTELGLTPTQVRVLAAVASSRSISEAARRLGMSRGAVTTHLARTRAKIKSAESA